MPKHGMAPVCLIVRWCRDAHLGTTTSATLPVVELWTGNTHHIKKFVSIEP